MDDSGSTMITTVVIEKVVLCSCTFVMMLMTVCTHQVFSLCTLSYVNRERGRKAHNMGMHEAMCLSESMLWLGSYTRYMATKPTVATTLDVSLLGTTLMFLAIMRAGFTRVVISPIVTQLVTNLALW